MSDAQPPDRPSPQAAPDQWPAPAMAPAPIGPAPAAPVEIPKRRLHPLTPLLESFRLLIAVVLASSWQMYIRENAAFGVAIAVFAGVFGAFSGLLSWLYTGYRVVGGELQITEGVLIRKSRTLPLERLQGIEVAQPIRARIFGLAELRIEVAGANETEAPLSYLKLGEAHAFRKELLAVAGRGRAAEEPDEPEPEAGTPIARVGGRRLIAGAVLEYLPPTLLVFAVMIGALALLTWMLDSADAEVNLWRFGAVPILFGLAGSIIQMVTSILRNWNFTLSRADRRLRVERGVTEKHSNIVPLSRVTAVSVELPVMWRLKRWRRVRVSTASIAQQGTQGADGGDLLPVGSVAESEHVAGTAMPQLEWRELAAVLRRPPRRARWRTPFTWKIRGAGLGEDVFSVRYGLMKTTTVAVPYARIQQVEVTQGPLQRLQGLATVRARIAGSAAHDAAAVHRDAAEAVAIAAELRVRADAAAAREAPRLS
ncbi:PH domain-containing protein [Glycomyces xiaoerkulensis]|uniref:PH domain-containing protein n=1 Tax=Glycomyces xiaoerkulensis TaxID=2038139 RepID=UPI000C25A45E|nr:PH domain-containing protein [Glycomyces xiaoerkulensis]